MVERYCIRYRCQLPQQATSVKRASVSEQTVLPRDLRRLFESEPLLAEGGARFSADGGFRFERHNIRGKDKMTARTALAPAVMMALALGRIRAKAHDRLRPPPAQAA